MVRRVSGGTCGAMRAHGERSPSGKALKPPGSCCMSTWNLSSRRKKGPVSRKSASVNRPHLRPSRSSPICDQIVRCDFERSPPRGSQPGKKGPWRPQKRPAPQFRQGESQFLREGRKPEWSSFPRAKAQCGHASAKSGKTRSNMSGFSFSRVDSHT